MSHVNVYIRQRPVGVMQRQIIITSQKVQNGVSIVTKKDQNAPEREITLDGFWDGQFSQQQVFDTVGKVSCDKALSGFNATVICFGPTGSGKSYTIFGEAQRQEDGANAHNPQSGFEDTNNPKLGLVPRMLEYLFAQSGQRLQYEFTYHVSFIELYLDQPYDLLINRPPSRPNSRPGSAFNASGPMSRPASATGGIGTVQMSASSTLQQMKEDETRQKLNIRQSMHGPFYADKLTVKQVRTPQEALVILQAGYDQRTTYATEANERSSRSHAIFTVAILQKSRSTGVSTASLLSFVDLAGSENLSKQVQHSERQIEGQVINRTLSTLGNVINALATNKPHVPYRESKLTKLLQEALGGSSYTSMICNIYPLVEKENETFQTMQFANRCKNVINQPKVGVIDISGIEEGQRLKALIQEVEYLRNEKELLENENTSLKQELDALGAKIEYIDDKFENPLLKMSDASFERSIAHMSPNTRARKTLERNIAIEDYKKGGSKTMKIYSQQQQAEKQRKDQEEKERQEALASRDTVQSLKLKIKRQAQDIYNLNQQLKQLDQTHKNTNRDLRDQIEVLKDTIKNNEVNYRMKLQDIGRLNKEEIAAILAAQDQLFKNQQSVINSYTNKSRPQSTKLQQMKSHDEERKQIIEQLEESKASQISQIDSQYQAKIQQIVNASQQELNTKQEKIDSLQKYIAKLQSALLFIYQQYKRSATIIAEAKEGKLDSYLINEQQIIQEYLNQDFSSGRQRNRVKAAILVEPERDVKIIPNEIMGIINELQCNEAGGLHKSGSFSSVATTGSRVSSRPPSFRESKIPKDFMQPHLKTGWGLSRPMNVTLGMNVHISPRPGTASKVVHKGSELRDMSATGRRTVSAIGSQIGSLGGTRELVNKQYQQWGY